MSALQRLFRPIDPHAEGATAPLLFVFVAPTIVIVGLVGWIALAGLSWGAVILSLIFVVVMLVVVMAAIGRLLNDDHDV